MLLYYYHHLQFTLLLHFILPFHLEEQGRKQAISIQYHLACKLTQVLLKKPQLYWTTRIHSNDFGRHGCLSSINQAISSKFICVNN